MSGIVGMFGRDGAPADRPLLQALTHFLSDRGPDAREVWSDGAIGFGHTLLRTTRESLGERQPASLDGQFWITADARLDARAELVAALESAGRKMARAATDPELILHAYAAWGEDCVERLLGDFAFAIWDARRKTLFCARDHFGVKPFYYAELGDLFLFGNTLECLRLHPDISEELNEAAIADFLLFGFNCDVASTTFRDIRRLPAAHLLVADGDNIRIKRYWSAPIDGRIRYRRADDYIENFQILLQTAVADRLRTDSAGILLSGGLDSSSIAAVARELSARSGGTTDLRAYTVTYDSLIPDRDGAHAREVAEFLHLPHRCLAMDDLPLFDRWDDPELAPSEPVDDPFFAGLFDQYRMIAADTRVVLSGEGADNLMHFQMWPYAMDLLKNHEWRGFFSDVPRYLRLRPFPSRGIRRRIQRLFGRDPQMAQFPSWIASDLARGRNLEARWQECNVLPRVARHPIVPQAHASLSLPQWSRLFELADAGTTHCPVEVRYPFLDLRVVNYVLALPPFPWSFQKRLLREAVAGHLPEGVRQRPKTPLTGDPLVENLQRPEAAWVDHAQWSEQIDRYVNPSALPVLNGERDSERAGAAIRPLCLNFWLQSAQTIRYKLVAEARNG